MPIPNSILSILKAAVDAMATPTFHFAYGPVDLADPADWVAGSPAVFLEQTGWTAAPNNMVGKITQAMLLTFRAVVPKGLGDIDDEMAKVDSDLKEMMQAQDDLLRAAGMLKSDYQGSSIAYRLVEAFPGEIRVRFSLTWRQSRVNPEST